MTAILVVLNVASIATAAACAYWAWRAGEHARAIERVRAERAAARRRPAPTPPSPGRPAPALLPAPRPPMFRDPPRAIQPCPNRDGRTWFHIRTPGPSSFEWAGADWASPTALDFATEVIHAVQVGATVELPELQPVDPHDLVGDLQEVWRNFLHQLAARDVVVDAGERVGIALARGDLMRLMFRAEVRAKCWPAELGVTVPRRPGWQDVTR